MYIYHIEVGSDEATVAISTERKNYIKLLMACSRKFSIFPSANAQMAPSPLKRNKCASCKTRPSNDLANPQMPSKLNHEH